MKFLGGTVASWLARSTPERALRVRALAGDIVLCSWARHFTLTVPLSTQVYKWVPANLMLGGNLAMDQHPIQGGVEILSVASCYGNRDKLRPDGPLGTNADFTFYPWNLHTMIISVQRSPTSSFDLPRPMVTSQWRHIPIFQCFLLFFHSDTLNINNIGKFIFFVILSYELVTRKHLYSEKKQ